MVEPRIAEPDNEAQAPSELDEATLYATLQSWFDVDSQHSNEWRRTAREEFDFVAGEQWSPEDKRYLEDHGRPAIVFNRALAIIKAVAGIEINGRHETVYIPRGTEPGQVKANEFLSAAGKWMADQCDAEDEQSAAFYDTVCVGMGWTEARLDFEVDPDGQYIETHIDPLEMYWDNSARSKNLTDARRVWRVRKFTLADAQALFPDIPAFELDASWARAAGEVDPLKPVEDRRFRDENLKFDFDPKKECHIVQAQWWEREKYWRVADPQTGEMLSLGQDEYDTLQTRAEAIGVPVVAVQLTRRVYKQAFLGRSILSGVHPCPCPDSFTFQCITGERDRNKGTFFGLVRLMRDPQMWANKWLSQTLHILNTTAKGGILAEEDAFPDTREAQETYAQPDAITWVNPGAIQKGKIMQKPGAGIPTAYVNLLEFAISSIRDVTGINLELLGLRDVNQPGILEAQRKQAAMTILATLFDSLRRFRKQVGRVRLHYIQEYLSDGRIVRIQGQDGMQLVPLLRDQTLGRFDVIVDDAPSSPNQKQETWATLQMMLPAFQSMLTPEAVLAILEYSPLPSKLVDALKAMAAKPNPEAEEAKQIEKAGAQAKVSKDQASAQKDVAMAENQKANTVLDLASAASEQAQAELDHARAQFISAEAGRRLGLTEMARTPFMVEPTPSALPGLPHLPTVGAALPANPVPAAGPEPQMAPNPLSLTQPQ